MTNSPTVLTFGEAMLRLSPPGHARIEQADSLAMHVAGAESNVAVALTRLGHPTRWVSRLPDDGRGRRVSGALAAHGVDVSGVIWETDPTVRVGVFFVEWGAGPRPTSVIYDRADSAAARLAPSDLSDALIADCRHVHVTGITPALSASCAAATAHAVHAAKRLGKTVSLDLNYRAKLWEPSAAAAVLAPLAAQADLLISSEDDARLLFDAPDSAALRSRFGVPSVALTVGGGGAIIDDGIAVTRISGVTVAPPIIDRLGAGDAFAAGLVASFLEDGDLVRGGRLGVALAALKLTQPGDLYFGTRAEAEALASGETVTLRR